MTLYDDLGVSKDADEATIKRAYRQRAQKDHPDKGGDKERFHRAQTAYKVLSDAPRRARYDQDGNTEVKADPALVARGNLISLIIQIAAHIDPQVDIMAVAAQNVTSQIGAHRMSVEKNKDTAKKYERAAKRIVRRSGKENFVSAALEFQAKQTLAANVGLEEAINYGALMLELIADFKDCPDQMMSGFTIQFQSFSFGAAP